MDNALVLDEVYDVWFTPFWQTHLGYAILVGLGICLLLAFYGIMRFIRARRESCNVRSIRRLHALAEKVKKGPIEARKVYQEMTDTIKTYTCWRYGLPRGITDYELTSLLADKVEGHQDMLGRIIADAQMAKFGRVETLKAQVQNDIDSVISFIEVTAKSKP